MRTSSTVARTMLCAMLAVAEGVRLKPPRARAAAVRALSPLPLSVRRRLLLHGAAGALASGALAPPRPASAGGDGFVWMPLERAMGSSPGDARGREEYPPRFSTYLARFLLKYDRKSRRWWNSKAEEIPLSFSASKVRELRLEHYAEFTRSVELGLEREYAGPRGVQELVQLLRARFTSTAERRQLALLLTLLPPAHQPAADVAELLGEADNATVRTVRVLDGGAGYDELAPPDVALTPPAASTAGGRNGARAQLRAVVERGRVVAVEVLAPGLGYSFVQPLELTIAPPPPHRTAAPPRAADSSAADTGVALRAHARADGAVDSAGAPPAGPTAEPPSEPPPEPPPEPPRRATAAAVLAAPPQLASQQAGARGGLLPESATSVALTTLLPDRTPLVYDERLRAFRIKPKVVAGGADADGARGGAPAPAGAAGGAPPPPGASGPASPPASSATSLRSSLLGAADIAQERARESGSAAERLQVGGLRLPAAPRPFAVFDPVFGPIGRSPVEKQATLDVSQYMRLAFSGGLCAAIGHALLTPLDVVKTRVQARPDDFRDANFFQAAQRIVDMSAAELLVDARAARSADTTRAAGVGEDAVRATGARSEQLGVRALDASGAQAERRSSAAAAPAHEGAHSAAETERRMAAMAAERDRALEGEAPAAGIGMMPLLPLGVEALFRGIDASALGHFVSGAISFGITEYCRRVFTAALSVERAAALPPGAAVIGASIVGVCVATVGIAPFEAARVKMVSSGDAFARNVLDGIARLAREDGVGSFYGQKFRTLLLKDVPYAMVKFSAYDAVSSAIHAMLPSLAEAVRTSLAVSLFAGFASGVAAAAFSHPADTIFTRLSSRAKGAGGTGAAPPGPIATAREMLAAEGIGALYSGVGTRAIFSGLLLAVEFLIYDAVRGALHVGADDLQLFLDVLAGVRAE